MPRTALPHSAVHEQKARQSGPTCPDELVQHSYRHGEDQVQVRETSGSVHVPAELLPSGAQGDTQTIPGESGASRRRVRCCR